MSKTPLSRGFALYLSVRYGREVRTEDSQQSKDRRLAEARKPISTDILYIGYLLHKGPITGTFVRFVPKQKPNYGNYQIKERGHCRKGYGCS
jgi:hypothetical protein